MRRAGYACCLLLVWLLSAAWAEPPLPEGLISLDGRAAPALRLPDMDGETHALKDLRGRWVFVHFWASWCAPCRRELPTIARMGAALEEATLAIILVNTAESEDTVFQFLGAVAPGLLDDVRIDRDGQATEAWQPRGLPSTFLVDPEGRLRYVVLGGREWDAPNYLAFVRRLVATP